VTFAGQPSSLPGESGKFVLVLVRAKTEGIEQCEGVVTAKLPKNTPRTLQDGRALAGTGVWMTFESATRLPLMPQRRGMLLIRKVEEAPPTTPVSRMIAMRTRAQLSLRATLDQSGMAEALVLAQREGLDRAVNDRFAATGLSHLLSISGTHVGLVAALLIGLAAFLRIGGSRGQAGATVGVIGYVVFLGAPAAAARSAIQVVLALGSRVLQRPSEPYTVLAAAALYLLAAYPLNLLDAGFQLSFAGVIGLIAYRRPVAGALPRWLPKWIRDGAAASIAASIATIPIAALHFGQVAPIGIPASIIAVPLVGFAIPAVALVMVLAGISMPVARFFAAGADVLLWLVDRVAEVAVSVPYGHAPLSWSSLMAMLLLMAAVVWAAAWDRERRAAVGELAVRATGVAGVGQDAGGRSAARAKRWRVASYAAAFVAVVAWTPQLQGLRPGGAVEVHAIDVGQGDAVAIRTPHGRWILVDAGPRSPTFDAGRARVAPYLLDHGVRQIDLLVLTHPHADHIGGADAVFDIIGVDAVIDPSSPAPMPLYVQTMESAERRGAQWYRAGTGRHVDLDGVRLEFLHPAGETLDPAGDLNDFSVVFQLRYGEFSAVFTGDAGAAIEAGIIDRYGGALRSGVLKVGHHGSATSTSQAFLDAVDPDVALISVGRDNRYRHPNPAVLARLLRHRVRVLRTDEQGSLVVRARPDGSFRLATVR
jgi:competence protein ComEC